MRKRIVYIVALLFIVSCSDNNESIQENPDNSQEINDGSLTTYTNNSNSINQLLSEARNEETGETLYFYGKTDNQGLPDSITSLAFKEDNSNVSQFFLFDEENRVKFIYSEINGVKQNTLIEFTYPQAGIVNLLVKNRDWTTTEDELIEAMTVEINGDEATGNNILGRANNSFNLTNSSMYGIAIDSLATALLVGSAAVTLVAVGTTFGAVPAVISLAVFASAASAAEQDIQVINTNSPNLPNNSEAPESPDTTSFTNQCSGVNIEVVMGIDDNNVITAIVNGVSSQYEFFWSTGETNTSLASDSITVSENDNYYVIVKDDNGCIGFGSIALMESLKFQLVMQSSDCEEFGVTVPGGTLQFEIIDNEIDMAWFETIDISHYIVDGILTISCTYYTGDTVSFSPTEFYCYMQTVDIVLPINVSTNAISKEGSSFSLIYGYNITTPGTPCGTDFDVVLNTCFDGQITEIGCPDADESDPPCFY